MTATWTRELDEPGFVRLAERHSPTQQQFPEGFPFLSPESSSPVLYTLAHTFDIGRLWSWTRKVVLQERHVAAVRTEHDIEGIADQRHRAHHAIERDVA